MQFQSFSFILFFIVIFFLYWNIPHKYRWGLLLAAGYFFYACWNLYYVLLLIGVTAVTYFTALGLGRVRSRKALLWAFVLFEAGILILFKYLGFFSEIVESAARLFGNSLSLPVLNLLLPVGISFYIFQTIAYVTDVYYGRITAERHFGYLAAGVAFFPILLSGPIERLQNLTGQFREEKIFSEEKGWMAFQRILTGYFKKMIIADSLFVYVNSVYSDLGSYTGLALLLAVVLYSIEIYCDFSGYSDIAIGVAGLFGIELHPNFEQPYLADSVKNFWRRWHISLSSWFRDYVYIPLGGSRVSVGRNCANIMITFLLSGLWHGAAWTFVFWGALHGFFQIVENLAEKAFRYIFDGKNTNSDSKLFKLVKWFWTFILISVAWVFFRAETMADAWYVLAHCFTGISAVGSYLSAGIAALNMPNLQILMLLFFIAVQIFSDIYIELRERKAVASPIIIGIAVVALFYYLRYGTDAGAFIYFQF